jgi:cysteine-rich repeat protein
MKLKFLLVVGVVVVAATQAEGCSSNFDSCGDTHSCSAMAGAAAAGQGEAGQAPDNGTAGAVDVGEGGEGGAAGGASTGPVLFGSCSAVDQVACQAVASAQRLACDGAKWQAGTTCADGELCDSSTGGCAKIIAECAAAKPNQKVCRGDKILTCGPDLVTADEGTPCEGSCKDGVCQAPSCGDQKVEAGEDCDDDALAASGACVKCKTATCGDGVVYLAHEECDDGNTLAGDGCSATCVAEPVALALGAASSCALSSIGVVKCWGDNAHGALGQGDNAPRGDLPDQMGSKLTAISLGTNRIAKAISATTSATCALLDNGSVKCWGENDSGQLGTGDLKDRGDKPGEMGDALNAIPFAGGHVATSVSIGGSHACAVLDNGSAECWGAGTSGQLGLDDKADRLLVGQLLGITLGTNRTAKTVNAGVFLSTCAVLDDASAKCWGFGENGQLSGGSVADLGGDGVTAVGDRVGEMAGLPALSFGGNHTAKSIVTGINMACAILDDDTVKCWGLNTEGQLGQGSDSGELGETAAALGVLPPIALGTARKAKSISAGYDHVCAVLDDTTVKCWGNNDSGQLGVGSIRNQGDDDGEMGDNLKAVPLGHGAHQVATGQGHSCALLDNGTVVCWGLNDKGQLGVGNTSSVGDTGGLAGVTLTPVDLAF